MDNIHIQQIALHHRTWSSADVRYAVDSLAFRHGPEQHLARELSDWWDGLTAQGWPPQKASRFTSDMRRCINGKRLLGPWSD